MKSHVIATDDRLLGRTCAPVIRTSLRVCALVAVNGKWWQLATPALVDWHLLFSDANNISFVTQMRIKRLREGLLIQVGFATVHQFN